MLKFLFFILVRMPRKVFRSLKLLLAVILFLSSLLLFLAFRTEYGLQLMHNVARKIIPIDIESLKGSLLQGAHFQKFSIGFLNTDVRISTEQLYLKFNGFNKIDFSIANLTISNKDQTWLIQRMNGQLWDFFSKKPSLHLGLLDVKDPRLTMTIKQLDMAFVLAQRLKFSEPEALFVKKGLLNFSTEKQERKLHHVLSIDADQWTYQGLFKAQGSLKITKCQLLLQGQTENIALNLQEPVALGQGHLSFDAHLNLLNPLENSSANHLNIRLLNTQLGLPTLGKQFKLQAHLHTQGFDVVNFAPLIKLEAKAQDQNGKTIYCSGGNNWPNKEILLKIKSDPMDLVRHPDLFLAGNLDLQLKANPQHAQLTGEIYISKGKFQPVTPQKSHLRDSSDIVWSSQSRQRQTYPWILSFKLIIDEHLEFYGHGLQAKLGGKLNVISNQQHNALMQGEGRLTIKSGKYRINGRYFYIHHGRILFPAGTLLTKPTIDLRLTPKPISEFRPGEMLGLHAYGPIDGPKILPFSSQHLSDDEILSQLGFANPFTVLFGNTSNSMVDHLQKKLGFDTISLETKASEGTEKTAGSQQSSQISLNKSLSKNAKLELMTDLEGHSKARVKYKLAEHTEVALESGMTGNGADFLWSWEKD